MRKMKDSGIEWIGEIPESWEIHRVKNHFSIISGSGFKTDYQGDESGDFPVCKASDISNAGHKLYGSANYISQEVQRKEGFSVIPAGSILFAKIGEAMRKNNRTLTMVDACADNNCQAMVPQNMHSEYAYYLFSCIDMQWFDNAGTIPCINNTKLLDFKMAYPSMEEQLRIADYLDQKCAEIDAIIAAKEKTNELLKERRQSIIYEAVTKGLDPTVPMKDSGIEWIGEIPESWDICPVKYVIDKNHPYPVGDGDHGLIKADDYLDEGIPYIRVLNLTWGEGLNLENLVYISDEMNSRIKNSELKPNDILIAKTGATIGKTAIVPDSLPQSNTTSHVGKITISSDHDAVFFYYVMTSSIVQRQIQVLSAMQSTRPELGIDGLRNLLVVVPPVEKQRAISDFLNQQCEEINSIIDTNSSMIDKLKEYRQSVIYEAVTGKVEI